MKKFIRLMFASTVLVPAMLSAASFEGKVNFKMTSGKEKPMEITYNIKGDKMRLEFPGQKMEAGMVMDAAKREMLMIMDEQKMYMVMALPESSVKAIEKSAEDVKIEKTGETEKILGYTATKYVVTSKDSKSDVWLAEGLGTFVAYTGNPMGRGRGGPPGQAQDWHRAFAGKDLFPLRVVGVDKGGKEFRMEATLIEKKSFPDSMFVPPPGYQKFDMGGMMKGVLQGIGR
jgi:hypothetical protein